MLISLRNLANMFLSHGLLYRESIFQIARHNVNLYRFKIMCSFFLGHPVHWFADDASLNFSSSIKLMSKLKAHRQISKKQCFEKYCSCDQACQFSASQGTPWRSYIENLTIVDKFINKRVRLLHIKRCVKKKQIISTS